jgi:hypothetical protein
MLNWIQQQGYSHRSNVRFSRDAHGRMPLQFVRGCFSDFERKPLNFKTKLK